MAKRVGIELSPLACRIVELDGDVPGTCVTRYAIAPAGSDEMSAQLALLRRREAAVVVWGVASDHRQVVVSQRDYEDMRAEAVAAVHEAGVQTEGMAADIARAGPVADGRQPVILTLAASQDLSAAVGPLVEAGVRIGSVVTPADALASLARTRRAFTAPGAIEAYVALEEAATSVALIRDGAILSACELSWGYLETDRTTQRRRDDVALQLVDDLRAFFSTVGAAPGSVRQLLICGGLPELRSMTVSLMEKLDLEVEPLDSLLSIDEARLPEPAGDFRERVAELRLAWAVAADRTAPINLMRPRRRLTMRSSVARAAAVAGVVVGVGLGWRIAQNGWLESITHPTPRSAPKPAARVTAPPPSTAASPTNRQTSPDPAPAPTPGRSPVSVPPIVPAAAVASTAAGPRPAVLPPSAQIERPRTPVGSQATTSPRASVPVEAPRVAPPPPRASVAVEAPRVAPPPARTSVAVEAPRVAPPPARTSVAVEAPRVAPPPPRTSVAIEAPRVASPRTQPLEQPLPRVEQPAPRAIESPAPRPPASSGVPISRPLPSPPARAASAPEAPPAPFDAVLGTILYSSDRRLAIIDGRIVGAGDEVKGARIVEITLNSVLLRDAQGRLRSLTLGASGR